MTKQARHILDEYRLQRILRSTVWTTVLRALEPGSEHPVVIKLIHPAGPVAEEANRSRFSQLMGAAQRGAFPGLPRVLDFGFTPDNHAFLVSEPMAGGVALSGLRSAPPAIVAAALVRVLDTVDELAMAGVAHLNLSLDNILVMDRSVRVVGNGTGAYLVGAPSRAWPPEGARCAAPELYGRDVLERDDLWLADLYAVAMMACDALGARVEGLGSRQPAVRLDTPGVAAAELEEVAAAALRRDPAARAVSLSELRRALVKGVLGDTHEEEDGEPQAELPGEEHEQDEGPSAGSDTLLIAAEAPPSAPRRQARTGSSGVPWALVAAAVLVAVLGGVTTLTVLGRSMRPAAPVGSAEVAAVSTITLPTPAPTLVMPTPAPVGDPRLDEAERLLSEGDRDGARTVLEAIPEADLSRLTPPELGRYEELAGALESGDRDAALRDLRGGLEAGSIPMLRRAVAALGDLDDGELRADPDLREDLEQARAALRQHRELWDADRAGDRLRVVEGARRMIALLPDYSGAYRMREAAAAALEGEAAAAAARRDFAGAVAVLDGLRAAWPEREGLGERIAAWQQQQQRDRQLDRLLEQAAAAGRSGRPDAGLRLLAAAGADEARAERVQAARAELQAELARLDAEPPRLSVPADLELRYRKNETVTVPITVSDDFRVEQVVVHLKAEHETAYRDLPLEPAADGVCQLRIPPEMHGNGTVVFWIEAVDVSSHRGTLGDVTNPLVLERKRWYQR